MKKETFNDYLEQRQYSKATIENMNRSKKRFRLWLKERGLSVYQVDYATVIAYIDHMQKCYKFKALTINNKLSELKQYFNFLSNTKNHFQDLKVKGEKQRVKLGLHSEEDLQTLYLNMEEQTDLEKRAKLLAGFYIFQGISTTDLSHMQVQHIQLKQGRVVIPKSRRYNKRILPLHPLQMFLLMECLQGKESNLFLYQLLGLAENHRWVCKHLRLTLKQQKEFKGLRHLRSSVIQNWLKRDNLRQAQYQAGHRYITSTEKLLAGNYTELQKVIQERHPFR